jgi:hypothetical protein
VRVGDADSDAGATAAQRVLLLLRSRCRGLAAGGPGRGATVVRLPRAPRAPTQDLVVDVPCASGSSDLPPARGLLHRVRQDKYLRGDDWFQARPARAPDRRVAGGRGCPKRERPTGPGGARNPTMSAVRTTATATRCSTKLAARAAFRDVRHRGSRRSAARAVLRALHQVPPTSNVACRRDGVADWVRGAGNRRARRPGGTAAAARQRAVLRGPDRRVGFAMAGAVSGRPRPGVGTYRTRTRRSRPCRAPRRRGTG